MYAWETEQVGKSVALESKYLRYLTILLENHKTLDQRTEKEKIPGLGKMS